MDEPLPQQAQRGPYIEHPPEAFVIDQDGFAWVRWPDGSLSMVRSTDANTRTTVVREYRPVGEQDDTADAATPKGYAPGDTDA